MSLRLSPRLAVVLLWSCTATAFATELAVDRFGPERGLSGHPLTAIARDRADRIWVGSFGGGAFRYDGVSWRQFTSRDGLLSDRVVALVPGSQGEMWVSTARDQVGRGGLSIVHGDAVLPSVPGEQWEASTGIETASGDVWFAFRSGGVGRFGGSLLAPVPGLEDVRVRRIVEMADASLWMMGEPVSAGRTGTGILARWDGTAFRRFGQSDGLPLAPFYDLLGRSDGSLWVATGSGPFWFGGVRFDTPRVADLSLERAVFGLSEDNAGRVWLAVTSAVVAIAGESAVEYRLPFSIGPVDVLEVAGSPQGGVFARTASHLLRLEGRSAETLGLGERVAILPPGDPEAMLQWESTLDEVLATSRPLLTDHEGSVWALGTRSVYRYTGDEARRFDREDGLPSTDVRAVLADAAGRLWVGTSRGVARFDPELGFFQAVTGTQEPVNVLFADRGGVVYAGLAKGVLRAKDLELVPWALADELSAVTAFTVDADGALWLGHEHGVAKSTADGLLLYGRGAGLAVSPVLALRATATDLWVGQASGLYRGAGERFTSVPALEGIRVEQLLPLPEGVEGEVLAVTPVGLFSAPSGRFVPPGSGGSRLHAACVARSGHVLVGVDVGLLVSRGGVESLLSGGPFPTEPVRAIVEDQRSAIWLGTGRGLYRHAPRKRAGAVRIDPFGVERVPGVTTLGKDRNDLWVRLSGVSYLGPRGSSDIRYQTRLLPLEAAFSDPHRAPERYWIDLAPGDYTLEARGLTRELVLSDVTSLAVTVAGGELETLPPTPTPSVEPEPDVPEPAVGAPTSRPPRRLVLPPVARP